MSNVYIKTKIRSGNYAMEYLRKIVKNGFWLYATNFLRRVGQSIIYWILWTQATLWSCSTRLYRIPPLRSWARAWGALQGTP